MRFLDMEGGPAIFAEPNEIAERYHLALQQFLDDLKQVVRRIGRRLSSRYIDDSYEQLSSGSWSAAPAPEVCDEFPPAAIAGRASRWPRCRSSFI